MEFKPFNSRLSSAVASDTTLPTSKEMLERFNWLTIVNASNDNFADKRVSVDCERVDNIGEWCVPWRWWW